jgi:hypothetical protein
MWRWKEYCILEGEGEKRMEEVPFVFRWLRGGVLVGVRNGEGDNNTFPRLRDERGGVFISEGIVVECSTIVITVSIPRIKLKAKSGFLVAA